MTGNTNLVDEKIDDAQGKLNGLASGQYSLMAEGGSYISTRAAGANDKVITFTKPFHEAPIININIMTSVPDRFMPYVKSVTKTGATIGLYNTGSASQEGTTVKWIAMGW